MLTIIGCGNSNRSDDGVGVWVARRLMQHVQEAGRSDVRVFDAGTGGMDVMFRARGADKLVLIDASRSGSEAGAVHRVPGHELEQDYAPAYSLHDFRWDHALHAGRRIFGESFPADVLVFLIEAGRLELGLELSEPVREAATRVAAEIASLIDSYGATAGAGETAPVDGDIHSIRIARGSLHLARELCDRYFGGVESVAVVVQGGRAILMPLRGSAAGGLLLKVRNARGDRVVHAPDFLRTLGIDESDAELSGTATWDPGIAGLVLDLARSSRTPDAATPAYLQGIA